MNGTRGALPMVFNNTMKTRVLNPVIPFAIPQVKRPLTMAERLAKDPALLCADAENYRDKAYVTALSKLYLQIAADSKVPAEKLEKFKIADFEVALAKLAKEYRSEYKELCKYWGVVPEEHRSKPSTKCTIPATHLTRLCNWEYIELFFTNMDSIIKTVARKTYSSHPMSDLEKAKYAQIFVMFIIGHSMMYYDLLNFQRVEAQLKAQGGIVDESKLERAVLVQVMKNEKGIRQNGSLLHEMYTYFLSNLPDGAINIDAIIFFLDMVDYDYKLQIKEFMDMLTVYSDDYNEKTDFRSRNLTPIITNFDVRLLKEKLFPCGLWDSELNLFMTDIPDEKRKSFYYAFERFKKNGYAFGKNVEGLATPESYRHPASKTPFERHCYVYSRTPSEIRVSDQNELWLMRLV